MCNNHPRRQRRILANAILTSLQEYSNSRNPRPYSPSSSSNSSSHSFQEPMTKGIAYMPPHYTEEATIDPNPPAYESLASTTTPTTTVIDEKQQLCRLRTEEQVPPHVSEGYNPNTGLDSSNSAPRYIPPTVSADAAQLPSITLSPATTRTTTTTSSAPQSESLNHLLASITQYFDTQIKLHSSRPATVRKLEYKKAKKLLKAEKKYKDHLSKGKDMKYETKMEKRAEKMEKWTEFMVKKSVGKHEKHVKKHGRCCDHVPVNQQ
ncbi:hypothetical protein TWF106_008964 [Orbilia oligospora]|uniref:Uncharacterized protein n=1 Tax=Orbilia oligospora TaxID=2813651 RepID=A0A6G1MCJ6_ORBOL|nr:hypothetical protein TWF191_010148 [Orbilia oligospora]KAF3214605.1 hypothetical protein TWF106_008964 [Orbilia oligospora]KAF3222377.1 hypothetical protein TWF679_005855 [Orbilia oligospora]KAF3253498.1 hypothetical protein TWF192_003749 [Orbilia oligospora]